ncbi:MAG: hypothetical protein AAGI68_16930 [Planctomycetota bacterium]
MPASNLTQPAASTVTAKPRGRTKRMRALLAVGLLGGSLSLGGCATSEGNALLFGAGLGALVGAALVADTYDSHHSHRGHYYSGYHTTYHGYSSGCRRRGW